MFHAILLTISNFCFLFPDGGSLCLQQDFNRPVNVVYECAYAGDPTVPLHVNSGVPGRSNPGPGYVHFISRQNGVHTKDREGELILSLRFESRDAAGGNTVNYSLPDPDLIFADDFRFNRLRCACHATDVDAERGCPDYIAPPDPPIP